jgi:hypothetical protein
MTQTVLVDSNITSAVTPAPAPWSAVAAIGIGAFALVTAEFLPVGLLPQIANGLAITAAGALCGSLWIIARFFRGTPVSLTQP